ncbi:TetR/AcrR family transcriptional regulator [Deferribacter autotrophicus]|uniref:TetR/AcrR family transcriptional regulator n=1 Tax=Deferribacter autotrophicus TaxID=500465 RepID=A0A5A8F4X6_9BACT|nr:TetR/AcrR family transcriptional regulator [Deferribacter autotrophicus]KAA0259037.1 TetR/AcrR family transcriptional regulator [Deferribacter autotrophicus]
MKDTKEVILGIACRLFAEKGYKKTTIAEICKLAKVNIASVNYYFQSKDNLYRNSLLFAYQLSEKQAPLKKIISQDLPPEKKLYNFIKTVLIRNYSDSEASYMPKIFLHEITSPTGICDDIISNIKDEFRTIIISILKEIINVENEMYHPLVYSIISQCLFLNFSPVAKKEALENKSKNELISFLTNHIYKFSMAALKNYKDVECPDI